MTRALALAVVDATIWGIWSIAVGYLFHRVPARRLAGDNVLTRLRPFEEGGRPYRRMAIKRWKDLLPETGGFFRGGVSKRRLSGRDPDSIDRFIVETRRAELVHWCIPLLTPAFTLWNPPALSAAMAAYAVVANVPCLFVQRYNRGRLLRIRAMSVPGSRKA